VEYELCKTFGWTINELYEQPLEVIMDFIQIINIERKKEKEALNKAKRR